MPVGSSCSPSGTLAQRPDPCCRRASQDERAGREKPAAGQQSLTNLGRLLVDCIRGHLTVGRAMTFPATVHPSNGQFEAALVGAPDVRAIARTRDEALAALEAVIAQRLELGELVALEVR